MTGTIVACLFVCLVEPTAPAVPVARWCPSDAPIPYRASTDADLRRRLRRHNAAYRAACPQAR